MHGNTGQTEREASPWAAYLAPFLSLLLSAGCSQERWATIEDGKGQETYRGRVTRIRSRGEAFTSEGIVRGGLWHGHYPVKVPASGSIRTQRKPIPAEKQTAVGYTIAVREPDGDEVTYYGITSVDFPQESQKKAFERKEKLVVSQGAHLSRQGEHLSIEPGSTIRFAGYRLGLDPGEYARIHHALLRQKDPTLRNVAGDPDERAMVLSFERMRVDVQQREESPASSAP